MLTINIVSDVVCPWCYVAYKQLEIALEECVKRCGDGSGTHKTAASMG